MDLHVHWWHSKQASQCPLLSCQADWKINASQAALWILSFIFSSSMSFKVETTTNFTWASECPRQNTLSEQPLPSHIVFFLIKHLFIYYSLCLLSPFLCVSVSMCTWTCGGQRTSSEIGSWLSLCGFWNLNSGFQTWWWQPLPTKPFLQPSSLTFISHYKMKNIYKLTSSIVNRVGAQAG